MDPDTAFVTTFQVSQSSVSPLARRHKRQGGLSMPRVLPHMPSQGTRREYALIQQATSITHFNNESTYWTRNSPARISKGNIRSSFQSGSQHLSIQDSQQNDQRQAFAMKLSELPSVQNLGSIASSRNLHSSTNTLTNIASRAQISSSEEPRSILNEEQFRRVREVIQKQIGLEPQLTNASFSGNNPRCSLQESFNLSFRHSVNLAAESPSRPTVRPLRFRQSAHSLRESSLPESSGSLPETAKLLKTSSARYSEIRLKAAAQALRSISVRSPEKITLRSPLQKSSTNLMAQRSPRLPQSVLKQDNSKEESFMPETRKVSQRAEKLMYKFTRTLGQITGEDLLEESEEDQDTASYRENHRQQVEKIVKESHSRFLAGNKRSKNKRLCPIKGHGNKGRDEGRNGLRLPQPGNSEQAARKESMPKLTMPSKLVLRASFINAQSSKRQRMISEVSEKKKVSEGMLSVKKTKLSQQGRAVDENKLMNDYLKNFSSAAQVLQVEADNEGQKVTMSFGQALKEKAQMNFVKERLLKGLQNKMRKAAIARENGGSEQTDTALQLPTHKRSLFEVEFQTKEKEIQNSANKLERSFEYRRAFKGRDLSEQPKSSQASESLDRNTRINFAKKCLEQVDLTLNIFDKVHNKTLCLQNYHLTRGHCEAISQACQFLDSRLINRFLFCNNGMNGDDLEAVLEGAASIEDFKALIYKQNSVSLKAVEKMAHFFSRVAPNHLEELSLIDCKIAPSTIELLMDKLQGSSRLRKLALVKANHSEASFVKVVDFISSDACLTDLDLSWSSVRPGVMIRLLRVLKSNVTLQNLSLSFNKLLDDEQPSFVGSSEGNLSDLSPFNQEVIQCFQGLIKYNTMLVHLELQSTGLVLPAIKSIVGLLTKSQGLRCLHLCGNTDLSEQSIKWVRSRIRAKEPVSAINIPPHSSQYGRQQAVEERKSPPAPGNFKGLNIFAKLLGQNQSSDSPGKGVSTSKAFREGINLRNIRDATRIKGFNQLSRVQNFDTQKLIIQRNLGLREVMPGSAQWRVLTESNEDCWYCSQAILTIFLWKARVGELSCVKDPEVIAHYEDSLQDKQEENQCLPQLMDGIPAISGPFTGWRPQKMRNLLEWLMRHDSERPDFTQIAKKEGKIRDKSRNGPDDEEKKIVEDMQAEYYARNWHKIIMPFLRYRNPNVANVDEFSMQSLELSPKDPIFFHVEFVRPGRSTYVVQTLDAKQINRVQDQVLFVSLSQAAQMEKTPDQQLFPLTYVHEMVTNLRRDPVHMYVNQRHVKRVKTYQPTRNMFKLWKEDTAETRNEVFQSDYESTLIDQLLPSLQDKRRIQLEVINTLPVFLDFFHYMQARSKSYPLVDAGRITEDLIDKLIPSGTSYHQRNSLNNILIETCVQRQMTNTVKVGDEPQQTKRQYALNRSKLLELLFRFSTFLYTNQIVKKGSNAEKKHSLAQAQPGDHHSYNELSLVQAFHLFLDLRLKPIIKETKIKWQTFRDEQLWTEAVQRVFTLNERPIRTLFERYAEKGNPWLNIACCVRMVQDSPFKIREELIREAFAMSKQTVANEMDVRQARCYNRLPFVEFLEFLGRLVDLEFSGSDLDSEPLEVKLNYFLSDLLPIVGCSFAPDRPKIEEFSDSDDDY